ncbi:rhomboid family intramembrane serine protease [Pedobacter frigiditerrae]|uniref:rhomboid family intramembrane serine protease n=1 Tax=Pedobacter frigiditerrae TaxID=2530452 RepID=UPI0029305E88|nr:rhomboid family intramembrane serine protease [Pedobacter frigiditerrae]
MNNINIPPVVKNLIIINIIFYAATWVFKAQGLDLADLLGAHYFDSPKFQVWQPITYMFMHSDKDIMHIIFNMFGLYMFGSILENHYGAKRFINFYLITGLGAIFLQWVVQAFELYQITGSIVDNGRMQLDLLAKGQYNPEVFSNAQASNISSVYFGTMVGASGAVFGVMTAFAVLYPNLELMLMFIPFPVKAKYFIPGYIVLELYLGVSRIEGDTVAHFAHLGGALIGYILVKLWKNKNTYYDYYD